MPAPALANSGDDTLPFMTFSMMTLIIYPYQFPIPLYYHLTLAVVLFSLIVFPIKMLPPPRLLIDLPMVDSSFLVDVVSYTAGHPRKGDGVGAFFPQPSGSCIFHGRSHQEKDRLNMCVEFSF